MKRKGRRRGRRSEVIGSVRWKLFEMLREAGVPIVSVDQFWMQEGAYRGRRWDLARWGADFHSSVDGSFWSVHSWDTMTACVRFGFFVHHINPCEVMIDSKPPRKVLVVGPQIKSENLQKNSRRVLRRAETVCIIRAFGR